jgi:ABC-2 type transport system permease protein
MTTLTFAVRDSATMMRRDFRHMQRYPLMSITGLMVPIIVLLLFNYVFGGSIGSSISGDYIDYLVPGIMIMGVGSGCQMTAINLTTDLSEGIINRFRTMPIFRTSVLIGQVLGGLVRTMVSMALLVCVALAIGFRPSAGPLDWLAAIGILTLFVLALTWLSVALGLLAKTPAGASTATVPLQLLLPFLSSAFASPDSMPSGVRWFAENNPFTHVIDALRALFQGAPAGDSVAWALGWCTGLTVLGFLWAKKLFDRAPGQ